MIIGVPKEIVAGETRVALIPPNVKKLAERSVSCLIESGAGLAAGHSDDDYRAAGAEIAANADELFAKSDIVVRIHGLSHDADQRSAEIQRLRKDQMLIAMMDPLAQPEIAQQFADAGVTAVAMELVPRISRAQSMDVLSSMATLGGYRAVLLAASHAPRILPMMMTAAGTLQPSRVLILGAGVAGLQACATAKRLGAVVEAYDIRPAAQDQIRSVGATPIILDEPSDEAEGKGGYAKELTPEQQAEQQRQLTEVMARQDIIITTAAVPGKKSPILVTEEQVKAMKRGSVIVDLAAERGGNCALTQAGETVEVHGVTILGPTNLPAAIPLHGSQMYGNNITTLLAHLIDEKGNLSLDFNDEIVAETVIAHQGEIPQAMMRQLLNLPELSPPPSESAAEPQKEAE